MNVLTVTGRLTGDPVRRDTGKGMIVEFRVAVDGQRRLWLPVAVSGHLAGTCMRSLTVGRHVAVSGQLCVDEYAAGGELRRRWYLRGDRVTFLEPPAGREPAGGGRAPADRERAREAFAGGGEGGR